MAYDEELAERVRAALDDVEGVAEIKMFGGLCFTVGGNMAVGVSHDDLLVRLSPDDGDAALAEPGVRLMEIGSRTSRGFLVGGARGDEDRPEAARMGRPRRRVRVLAPAEEAQAQEALGPPASPRRTRASGSRS